MHRVFPPSERSGRTQCLRNHATCRPSRQDQMEAKLFSYRTDGNAGKPLDPWNACRTHSPRPVSIGSLMIAQTRRTSSGVANWRSVAPAHAPVLHRRPRLAALQRRTRRIAPPTCPDSPPVLRSEHRRATGLGEPASQNPAVDARAEDRESRYQQRFAVDNITEAAEDFERALQLDPVSRERKLGWRARGLPYCRSACAVPRPRLATCIPAVPGGL